LIPEKKGTAHLKLHCALFFAHSEKGISKTNTMWYVALKHFEGFAGK